MSRASLRRFWHISVCFFVFACATGVDGQVAQRVAKDSFPSVVMLVMEDANGQPVSLGSGFFVGENVIATNFHVIEGASRGYAKLIGKKTKYDIAGIVGLDAHSDLVLLAVRGANSPVLSIGDSSQVEVGDEVYAVGNPQGLEGTFSQGIVSSIREVGSDTLLQITTPISPGSSGGPVLNAQGKVVGVSVATFKDGQNLNFAIPVNKLASLISSSNKNSITPLASGITTKRERSIFSDLGGRSTEGVVGGKLIWNSSLGNGNYSFTIQNKLRDSVKNIYCLVIFYDVNGQPLDISVARYEGIIPGGLGKRVTGNVDVSVKKLTTKTLTNNKYLYCDVPSTRIEFRILDFQIAE